MDGKRRATGNLVIFGLFLLVGLACPMLLAQTQDAKPAAKGTERTILECDSSVMNPVPGESIEDAARRNRAWKNCVEAMKSAVEHMVKRVEVENGHLTVGAVPPGLATTPGLLNVSRLDIYVRNRSPIKHEYTLTARCGTWSQRKSDSVGRSKPLGAHDGLGEPTYSFEVSPPCNFMDVTLDVTSPDEIKGEPQQTSASVVPGVSEAEMAQRLRAIQGSSVGASKPSIWDKVNGACKQRSPAELVNTPTSTIGKDMTDCAKAVDEAGAAMTASKAESNTNQRTSSTEGTLLIVTSANEYFEPRSGYMHLEGEVRNVSGQSLNKVWAVVSYYTANGEYVNSDSAPIEFQPILPSQTSPFQIVSPGNPAITKWRLQFKIFGGGTVPSELKPMP